MVELSDLIDMKQHVSPNHPNFAPYFLTPNFQIGEQRKWLRGVIETRGPDKEITIEEMIRNSDSETNYLVEYVNPLGISIIEPVNIQGQRVSAETFGLFLPGNSRRINFEEEDTLQKSTGLSSEEILKALKDNSEWYPLKKSSLTVNDLSTKERFDVYSIISRVEDLKPVLRTKARKIFGIIDPPLSSKELEIKYDLKLIGPLEYKSEIEGEFKIDYTFVDQKIKTQIRISYNYSELKNIHNFKGIIIREITESIHKKRLIINFNSKGENIGSQNYNGFKLDLPKEFIDDLDRELTENREKYSANFKTPDVSRRYAHFFPDRIMENLPQPEIDVPGTISRMIGFKIGSIPKGFDPMDVVAFRHY